jgi:hypothetical protein
MILEAGPLPFVERTFSHRLRWPYRLVSELTPRPLLLRDEPFLWLWLVSAGLSARPVLACLSDPAPCAADPLRRAIC